MKKEKAAAASTAPVPAYRALPLQMGSEQTRYLFLRPHKAEPGGDEALAERTLFVASVPAWCASALLPFCSRPNNFLEFIYNFLKCLCIFKLLLIDNLQWRLWQLFGGVAESSLRAIRPSREDLALAAVISPSAGRAHPVQERQVPAARPRRGQFRRRPRPAAAPRP